jgi:SAM-dependent methyltransferase
MQDDDVCQVSVATFSRLADRYAEKFFDLDIYNAYLDMFAERIAQGGRVLDMACGPGNICAYLAKQRPDLRCVGVDLAEGMIEQARRRVPTADFLLRDCRALGELGPAFDAAAFGFGLSYLTDGDAGACFASLDTALAPAAGLYLATMTGDPQRTGFESTSRGDRVHITYRSVADVVAMVERAGFDIRLAEVIASPAMAATQTHDLIVVAQRAS